jgi:hypothetical protein
MPCLTNIPIRLFVTRMRLSRMPWLAGRGGIKPLMPAFSAHKLGEMAAQHQHLSTRQLPERVSLLERFSHQFVMPRGAPGGLKWVRRLSGVRLAGSSLARALHGALCPALEGEGE